MLIETKLAIQCKTQVFLARRSQYIVVVENNRWRQRSCAPMRKYASVACLFMSALNDIYKNKKFESNTEIENATVDVKLPRRMYRWMISEECIWYTMRKKCHYSELFWSTFLRTFLNEQMILSQILVFVTHRALTSPLEIFLRYCNI